VIRTAALRAPASRTTAALFGAAGALALAGCSVSPASGQGSADGSADGGSYADGTYTAKGSYATPEAIESITVTVTLVDDVITDVEVEGAPTRPESSTFQGMFIGGIADQVVGKDIDEISVSRVAGSSLTSGGFNGAIEQIRAEAAD
jgi:hypothetical protein